MSPPNAISGRYPPRYGDYGNYSPQRTDRGLEPFAFAAEAWTRLGCSPCLPTSRMKAGTRRQILSAVPRLPNVAIFVTRDQFRDFLNQATIAVKFRLLLSERANDFRLSAIVDLAVAGKRGHNVFMPKVLRPSLEFFRRLANLLPEQSEGLAEGMGIEIREPRSLESRSENRPNRRGVSPTFPIEPGYFEMTAHTKCDARRRKERIVEPPKPLLLQKRHPFGENARTSSPTGKKKVVELLENLVRTCLAS